MSLGGCNSVTEHMPRMCETLNSIPNTAKEDLFSMYFRWNYYS